MRRALLGILVILVSTASAQAAKDVWFGGGVGLSFGTVDYVEIQPVVGMTFTERVSGGLSVLYRYRDDGRYSPSISTSDYGGSVFARYRVAPPVFLQAEYEYLDYEFVRFDGSKGRSSYDSALAGIGFWQRTGGRMGIFAVALYNLSYSASDPGPYSDPWVFRAGVSLGF